MGNKRRAMSRRIISLIIGMIIGGVVVFLAMNREFFPTLWEIQDYRIIKQQEIDSLSELSRDIARKRQVDSVITVIRLEDNKKGIERLEHEIKKVDFTDYTDAKLDSIIQWLYPGSGI